MYIHTTNSELISKYQLTSSFSNLTCLLAQLQSFKYCKLSHNINNICLPQNILLSTRCLEEARVKVVDFGFARRSPECPEERPRMMTPCFSLPYAAPEVVARARSQAAPGYGPQCDLWSLGVVYVRIFSTLYHYYIRTVIALKKLRNNNSRNHYAY